MTVITVAEIALHLHQILQEWEDKWHVMAKCDESLQAP